MKALIFAAGLGIRLKPLTDIIPKALVPVSGKPLLEHIILKLKSAGVKEIIINIHHFPDQIINFVRSRNSFDISVEFSNEKGFLMDTGGGIKKASWFFSDGNPFIVHNVDILSDINLDEFYNMHIHSGALASLFVSNRKTSRYLLFDEEDQLHAWINEQTGEVKPPDFAVETGLFHKFAFNGIHVITPELFMHMQEWNGKFSIIDFYLSVAEYISIKAYAPVGINIIDVGKIESLSEAEIFLQKIS